MDVLSIEKKISAQYGCFKCGQDGHRADEYAEGRDKTWENSTMLSSPASSLTRSKKLPYKKPVRMHQDLDRFENCIADNPS